MIKKFFGADIIRSPHSADMFFNREAMCRALDLLPVTLDGQLKAMGYEQATGLIFDGEPNARALRAKYGLDALLGLVFSAKTKTRRHKERYTLIADFVKGHVNAICYDGFSSLTGWRLSEECRRAITAHICGVEFCGQLPEARIRPGEDYHGSLLRNYHCSPENLSIPEVWVTRAESTKIRAIDLAVYLLCENLVDLTTTELLLQLGVNPARGIYTEEQRQQVVENLAKLVL